MAPRSPIRLLNGLVASVVDRWPPWRSGSNGSAHGDQRIIGDSSLLVLKLGAARSSSSALKLAGVHTKDEGIKEVGFNTTQPWL